MENFFLDDLSVIDQANKRKSKLENWVREQDVEEKQTVKKWKGGRLKK